MLKLVEQNDPVLKQVAKPVKKYTKELKNTVSEMFETMYASNGIGLAAPQVGISLQIITIDIGNDPFVIINPKIVKKSSQTVTNIEACLSFPDQLYAVERSQRIIVKAKDVNGRDFSFTAVDWTAICIQHEYDHLLGITFDTIGTPFSLKI